jgi:pyridinium-3,5-biscarboxylic acid mononucleotide synthase
VHGDALRQLIDDLQAGRVSADDAVLALRRLPYADLGFARVDHHRSLRQGMAEVVYAPGKDVEHCVAIVAELLAADDGPVLVSRVNDIQREALLAAHPNAYVQGHTLIWRPAPTRPANVLVAAAGTADLAVADECAAVLGANGVAATRLNDVGVAGLHRLLAELDTVLAADVVIAVAGMEGALASVIGGLTAAPVIAVPTSVGYGSSLEGVTALLAMLSSCASGVTVVGIDNGFGAACAALRLLDVIATTDVASRQGV